MFEFFLEGAAEVRRAEQRRLLLGAAIEHALPRIERGENELRSFIVLSKLFFVPLQLFLGDQHGLNTRRYQPMKIAAIEARWQTAQSVPLTLFAWPDQKAATNLCAVDVPYLGSLILTHSWNGEVKGLEEVSPKDRPYVPIVFFAFRAMVGIGSLLLVFALLGAYLRWRSHLFGTKWFLVALLLSSFLGFVATIAGWVVTEAGRQPYVVYGVVRTANVASHVDAVSVGITFLLFIAVDE